MYQNNKINISGLEINISERCNLNCKGCDHAMSMIESKIIPISELVTNLVNASRYFHSNTLRIIGGEPLLHPELAELIFEFSQIGIANSIELWTNGTLLKNVKKENWNLLDGLVISSYPKINLKLTNAYLNDLSNKFNVWINIRNCDTFSWSMGYKKHHNKIAKILHDSCRESSTCNTIRNGKFYKCVQSAFAEDRLETAVEDFKDDGIILSGSLKAFNKKYQEYMWSDIPINACHFCFGEYGDQFPHILENKSNNYNKEATFNEGFILPRWLINK